MGCYYYPGGEPPVRGLHAGRAPGGRARQQVRLQVGQQVTNYTLRLNKDQVWQMASPISYFVQCEHYTLRLNKDQV